MTKHTVKTIASGEYSCSCGAVWDRDEGDECPADKELPGMWEASDLSGGQTDCLKAQPSGVVLPEPMKRGDEGGSGEYGAAMIRGYNACLREVARLNSPTVSASCATRNDSGHFPFSSLCPDCRKPVSAGGVDERAAFEAAIEASGGMRPGNYSPDYDRYVSERLQGQYEGWKLARATLTASAPNHSEQVLAYISHGAPGEAHLGWAHLPIPAGFARKIALIAAPSAGSQQGG